MKKILIVNTQSMNHNNATGITLRSIFAQVDLAKCYELYMQPCRRAKDALSLRSEQVPASVCLLRSVANRFVKNNDAGGAFARVNKSKKSLGFRTRLIAALDYEPIVLTRGLLKKVREFSPDCIYTLGNAIDAMKLAVKISKRLNIPIVPHFMDNWQASHRYGPTLYPYHKKRTQVWLKRLYARTEKALTISPKMAEEYQARWGKPHVALMNSVDVEYFHEGAKGRPDTDAFVLTYAGGLHLNRYKSIIELGKAMDIHNQGAERPLRFDIYTDDKSITKYGDALREIRSIHLHDYVPHDRILDIYKNCDALIHIETFDSEYREFIKYSLSTKISEFLAVSKPILLYAPKDIFVSEYLDKYGAAVVADRDVDLEKALAWITDERKAEEMKQVSYQLAQTFHDVAYVKHVLQEVFSNTERHI